MNRLIIARHGNTFEKGEIPRRVGARTDLPLTEKGRDQARALGQWLVTNSVLPAAAFCSGLCRTKETARIALTEAGISLHLQAETVFDEINYGPDENQTEETVIRRVGLEAIKAWDQQAVVPPGWQVDPDEIIANWQNFGNRIVRDYPDCTVLVVTSNGVGRFAPYLTGNFADFAVEHDIKLATGALGIMDFKNGSWSVKDWNVRP